MNRHRLMRELTPMPDPPRDKGQLRKRTVAGVAFMGASTAIRAILQIVILAVLARVLTPRDFGLVSGVLIAVFFATALAESGVGQGIIQRAVLTREHVRVGWTLSVLIGLLTYAIVYVLSPAIEDGLRLPGLTPLLRAVSLIFVLNGLTLSDFLLSRRMQFGRLAAAELGSYVVGYCGVAVTLGLLGYGPWAVVWGWVGQYAVRTVLVTAMAPFPYRPSLRPDLAGQLLNFGAGLTLGRIGSWAATQMDNIIVGRYLGAATLGLYGRAYQLVQIPANLFGQVATEVLFPAMSSVQDDHAKLRRVFGVSIGFMAALALPVSMLAAVTSYALVKIVLGDEWLPLRAAFDVIIFGLLFRTSSKLTDALQKARGAVYQRALRSIGFAVMVAVGAYLGAFYGLHGVAIGVLAALALNYLWSAQLCLKLIEMSWWEFFAVHLPALTLTLGAGVVGLVADEALRAASVSSVPRFVVVWVLGVLTCLTLVRVAWRFSVLTPVATLTATVQETLSGPPAKVMARLLGPGYRRMQRRRKQEARGLERDPDPGALADLAADAHAQTRVEGQVS